MPTRRQFLKQLGLGAAAGALGWPVRAEPRVPLAALSPPEELRIALLADAHLPSACPETATAKRFLQAVEEINAHQPSADLVFFAGDLSNQADFKALELGKEILSGLRAPCWLVPGEQDIPVSAGGLGQEHSGRLVFSFAHRGVYFCGCNTGRLDPNRGTVDFQVNSGLRRELAAVLAAVPPEAPLLIFTHAPLYRLFQPWGWWTEKAEVLHQVLAERERVFLLHGHVHQNITLQQENLTFQGLRSTAWPLPDVRIGLRTGSPQTPAGDRDSGCGWMLLTVRGDGAMILRDQIWA